MTDIKTEDSRYKMNNSTRENKYSELYAISLDGELLGTIRGLPQACQIARGLAHGIKRYGVAVEGIPDGDLKPVGFSYLVPYSSKPPHDSKTPLTVDEAIAKIVAARDIKQEGSTNA